MRRSAESRHEASLGAARRPARVGAKTYGGDVFLCMKLYQKRLTNLSGGPKKYVRYFLLYDTLEKACQSDGVVPQVEATTMPLRRLMMSMLGVVLVRL